MFRLSFVLICTLAVTSAISTAVSAQSNHDLLAPIKLSYSSPEPGMPSFAIASMTEDGKLKISTTEVISKTDPDPNADATPKPMEYTVTIPYIVSRTVNGKTIQEQKTRVEKRTRMVAGNLITTQQETSRDTLFNDHTYKLVDGTEISIDKAKQLLADRTPVLLLEDDQTLHPFIAAITKPDTIVVYTKSK